MTAEYVVLGVLLILMGAAQVWLRHGPWSKDEEGGSEPRQVRVTPGGRLRRGRGWNAWTAVMGAVGIVLGVVLVVLGVTGR